MPSLYPTNLIITYCCNLLLPFSVVIQTITNHSASRVLAINNRIYQTGEDSVLSSLFINENTYTEIVYC